MHEVHWGLAMGVQVVGFVRYGMTAWRLIS